MWIFKNILDKILWSNTLYYPWCLTKIMIPEIQQNYETILHNLWIDFIKLTDQEYCCWSPVLRAWLRHDFEEIKEKNIKIFKEHAVGLIITNCPACYNMLKYQYKLEEEHWIKVEHITQTLKRYESKIKSHDENWEITYHDPCHLWRHSGVYEEPRDIIKKYWYKINELKNNRENSMCCWWGWGLVNNNPELSEKICNQLLFEVGEWKTMTSPCPMCYFQFRKYAWDKNIKVKEFSEIVLERVENK